MTRARNTYVIVHRNSWRRRDKEYSSYGRARAAALRLGYNLGNPECPGDNDWTIRRYVDYIREDSPVAVVNLMSGKTVYIPKSQLGTCCDPSTETYWSM